MEKVKSDERIRYIDLVRGIAIIAIVWGHVAGGDRGIESLNRYCNFFKILVFYFIPGYLLKKEISDIKSVFKKKIKTLGIPYAVFSIIILVMDLIFVLTGQAGMKTIVADLYRTICLAGIGTLWFLPTLFIAQILLAYAIKKSKVREWGIAATIISITGIVLLNYFRRETMIFDIITAPIIMIIKAIAAFLFMLLGMFTYQAEKKMHTERGMRYLLIIGIFVISYAVCNIVKLSDFNHLMIENVVVWLMACSLSCISIVYVCKELLTKIPGMISDYIRKGIEFFGKNSLVIMCTHFSVLMPIFKICNLEYWWIEFILCLMLGGALSVVIDKKASWILGK